MRQLFLDEYTRKEDGKFVKPQNVVPRLRILNWNIAHASLGRAKKQADWLLLSEANVIILTEASSGPGSAYLHDRLESWGYQTIFHKRKDDFGTMLAFKGFKAKELDFSLKFLPHRAPAIVCQTPRGQCGVIGVYAPSSVSRNELYGKKRRFQNEFLKALSVLLEKKGLKYIIVCGDLNVLEPDHQPRYSAFRSWEYQFYSFFAQNAFIDAFRLFYPRKKEYSWFGREGNGYRFDHCFVSESLKKYVKKCRYLHGPREIRLSDHAAMWLEIIF